VDVELLRRFAALHRLKLELVGADSWEHLLPMLDADRADVAAGGVTDTAGRREQADFTAEVFPTRLVIVTRKPHRVVASVAELRNERVGTVRGSSMAEAIRAAGIPASAIDDSIASDGLVEALQSGRVSACVIGVTGALLARKRDPALQIGGWVGPPRALAWAVRKGAPQLRARLDEFLANIRRSGAWSELVVRYFGESALPILRAAREP
jgi:membrane-bound lytic murein transglycosylase F